MNCKPNSVYYSFAYTSNIYLWFLFFFYSCLCFSGSPWTGVMELQTSTIPSHLIFNCIWWGSIYASQLFVQALMSVTLEVFVDDMNIYNPLAASKADHCVDKPHLITWGHKSKQDSWETRNSKTSTWKSCCSMWHILNLEAPMITWSCFLKYVHGPFSRWKNYRGPMAHTRG